MRNCKKSPKARKKIGFIETTEVTEYKRGNLCFMGGKEIPRSQFEGLASSWGNLKLGFEPYTRWGTKRGPLSEARSLILASVRRPAGKMCLSAKGTKQKPSLSLLVLKEKKKSVQRLYSCLLSWGGAEVQIFVTPEVKESLDWEFKMVLVL